MDGIGRSIVEHLLISLLPLFASLIVGGGLGAVCALVLRTLLTAAPGLRKVIILLPWRTILVGLLLLIWTPFMVIRLGIGPTAGGLTVGLILCLLALVFTTGVPLEHWFPSPLAIRLLAGVRMLATASGVIAATAGFVGGGGVGHLMRQGMALLRLDLTWKGWLVVVILALILDVLIGVVQLVASFMLERSGQGTVAGGQETAV
jgi:hypothetical protein